MKSVSSIRQRDCRHRQAGVGGGKMRMRLILRREKPELEAPVLTHIQPSLWQHPHTFLTVPVVLLCGSSFLTHHYPPLSSVSAAGERISLSLVANHWMQSAPIWSHLIIQSFLASRRLINVASCNFFWTQSNERDWGGKDCSSRLHTKDPSCDTLTVTVSLSLKSRVQWEVLVNQRAMKADTILQQSSTNVWSVTGRRLQFWKYWYECHFWHWWHSRLHAKTPAMQRKEKNLSLDIFITVQFDLKSARVYNGLLF